MSKDVQKYFMLILSSRMSRSTLHTYIFQDIKLFEFKDVQKYSTYNDGPKSKEFCQFHTSSASKVIGNFFVVSQ